MKTCSMTERKVLGPGGSETGMGISIETEGRAVMATDIDETKERIQSPHVAGKGRPKRECMSGPRVIARRFRHCLG